MVPSSNIMDFAIELVLNTIKPNAKNLLFIIVLITILIVNYSRAITLSLMLTQ